MLTFYDGLKKMNGESTVKSLLRLEVSASAVAHNLRLIADHVGPNVRLCAGVKADCYGHGLDFLLPTIAEHASLFVATPEEAIRVRQLGCASPVLVLFSAAAYMEGAARREAAEELVHQGAIQTVVSLEEIPILAEAARRIGESAEVHVKVDTGMTRSGVLPEAAAELAGRIRATEGVKLTGILSHFATADEHDLSAARRQLDIFKKTVGACRNGDPLTVHIANSPAILDMPEAHLDMVRPGIIVYGHQPSCHVRTRLDLQPAIRLTGRLLAVKAVPAGSRCGYGFTRELTRPSRLARVPIGYGDGYLRSLSDKAVVRIHQEYAPVLGRVSMDQLIVDVTDISQARMGDEVEVISNDPGALNSVENLARLAETVPHDICCQLKGRMDRVLVTEST